MPGALDPQRSQRSPEEQNPYRGAQKSPVEPREAQRSRILCFALRNFPLWSTPLCILTESSQRNPKEPTEAQRSRILTESLQKSPEEP